MEIMPVGKMEIMPEGKMEIMPERTMEIKARKEKDHIISHIINCM